MSEKGGKILCRVWGCMDQADLQDYVDEAFKAIPTKLQKRIISGLLGNLHLVDKNSDLDEKEIEEYKRYVSG